MTRKIFDAVAKLPHRMNIFFVTFRQLFVYCIYVVIKKIEYLYSRGSKVGKYIKY
jgi:hypothetical protein